MQQSGKTQSEKARSNTYRKIEGLLLDEIKKNISPFHYEEALDAVIALQRLNEAYKNGK
jgi:hypothetical protein